MHIHPNSSFSPILTSKTLELRLKQDYPWEPLQQAKQYEDHPNQISACHRFEADDL
jgi:hypothetical protein